MGKSKRVSLILTTYNCANQLSITLDSIWQQDYENMEIIIKDGGSTDGTLEVIRKFQDKGKFLMHVDSAEDQGIYDAMNKGFQMSSGEIVAFFNDCFADRAAVSKLVYAMEQGNGNVVGAHGDLIYREGTKAVRYWKMGNCGNIRKGWMPAHPTLFLYREVYEKYGLYRTDLKCSADYEFMIRVFKDQKNQLTYVPEVLVYMFYGGRSNQGLQNYLISLWEGHQALTANQVKGAWLIDIRRTLKVWGQFAAAKKLEQKP